MPVRRTFRPSSPFRTPPLRLADCSSHSACPALQRTLERLALPRACGEKRQWGAMTLQLNVAKIWMPRRGQGRVVLRLTPAWQIAVGLELTQTVGLSVSGRSSVNGQVCVLA